MTRQQKTGLGAAALSLAGAMLAVTACSSDPPDTEGQAQAAASAGDGTSVPISQLPFVENATIKGVLGELLARPTALGETTALHVRLPPPQNPELAASLVRIVGPADSPQVLISADALEKLGVIARSPGKEFFTAFATLPPEQLDVLKRNQDEIASGKFGRVTNESVVFEGRSPVARTINPAIDPSIFKPGGGPVPINACPFVPVSTLQNWGQSLFIRDPAIVQDPARTWDPCTGAGTKGGVWTFAHLIREMANGSGQTPEVFVLDWLSRWLNDYTVNSDVVPARTAMFAQVIQPWATASGVTATLITDPSGFRHVQLSGPLNLDIAPFRLNAIVNRADLGATGGAGGYGGGVTSQPKNPGELRFLFNVVQPVPWGGGTEASCGRKHFTTIFEYGVPGAGCAAAVNWAKQWTMLQAFPGFTAAYKAQLQAMTESVVVHGAAPTKGNQNAINQVRTNEIALAGPWELREFTLTDEKPALGTDTPSNGALRTHSVAQTPNDGAFPPLPGDPTVNSFVLGTVLPGVVSPVVIPTKCDASYTVPYAVSGVPFRGGNALIGPGHWNTSSVTLASPPPAICARHQFSLNTCGGCHHDDSGTNGLAGSTNFTHIDPLSSIPVTLSKFLTGGGPGLTFPVADPQLGAPAWPFADLQRRLQVLYDLSHCTSCSLVFHLDPQLLVAMQDFGPIPIDPGPINPFPFKVGPITDLAVVQKLLDLRAKFATGTTEEPADFIRRTDTFAE
jgi:hypothetical protein